MYGMYSIKFRVKNTVFYNNIRIFESPSAIGLEDEMSPLRTLIFAAEEGHSWASMRGAVLKQPMGKLDQLGTGRRSLSPL